MRKSTNLWNAFIVVLIISFSVLLMFGYEIYREAPPIPKYVKTNKGDVLFTKKDIQEGQLVWQSIGGQELGTVWGHGAYVAPDWTADWLHREAVILSDILSLEKHNRLYSELKEDDKILLNNQVKKIMRENTFNPNDETIYIHSKRAIAIDSVCSHYTALFTDDPLMNKLREAYAMNSNTITDPIKMRKLNAFFFWATWATITERPGEHITYTHNWPPDKFVGNEASSSLIIWTGFSVVMLILGIGILAFYYAKNREDAVADSLPDSDPLTGLKPTPSMKATQKYFWVVLLLIIVQVLLGVITAHYGVEGQAFFGIPLAEVLPYTISRTWHLQLSIFWIATSWLATGLYMAPAISGYEPKFQRLGVNVLFLALLIVVAGSMAGEWMGVMQKFDLIENFWFGHQGFEYVDLGRFWQILLFVGLLLWLFLMGRAMMPALKKPSESKKLLTLFFVSSVAIAVLYSAGLMYGSDSHLSIIEYWRWWVVHLWVEGFFEVFATVITAFLFVRFGLLHIKSATAVVIFSSTIFLAGGILGTFHHLYFTGTPVPVLALGATFSALEVVPLVFMGFEAYHNYRISKATPWLKAYKWPIYFLISVAFWNLIGAGVFGFLINPPIALYYMQGLNTTPVHGHTAMFGVYGMLGIALMLFVMKGLFARRVWKEEMIKISFWALNIGLILMMVLSVFPIGLYQTVACVDHGMWYARSAEFNQQDIFDVFRWLRVIGDIIFTVGTVALMIFVFGLAFGWSLKKEEYDLPKK